MKNRRTLSRNADPRSDAPRDPEVSLDQDGEEGEDARECLEGFSEEGSSRRVEGMADESVCWSRIVAGEKKGEAGSGLRNIERERGPGGRRREEGRRETRGRRTEEFCRILSSSDIMSGTIRGDRATVGAEAKSSTL